MYLFLSVETDGVGAFFNQTIIRVALVLTNVLFETLALESFYVQGASILSPAVQSLGHRLEQVGNGLRAVDAKGLIKQRVAQVTRAGGKVVAHNSEYVMAILQQLEVNLYNVECTMKLGTPLCKLEHPTTSRVGASKEYKYPQLCELHACLFGTRDIGGRAEEKAWAVKQCYQSMHHALPVAAKTKCH